MALLVQRLMCCLKSRCISTKSGDVVIYCICVIELLQLVMNRDVGKQLHSPRVMSSFWRAKNVFTIGAVPSVLHHYGTVVDWGEARPMQMKTYTDIKSWLEQAMLWLDP